MATARRDKIESKKTLLQKFDEILLTAKLFGSDESSGKERNCKILFSEI